MRKLLIIVLLLLIGGVLQAQEYHAVVQTHLNVRQTPEAGGTLITTLAPQTEVYVIGRNEFGDWAFIRTEDNSATGWVAMGFIRFDSAIRIMQDLTELGAEAITTVVVDNGAGGSTVPQIERPPEIFDLPPLVMDGAVMRTVRQIYQRGQARGNDPANFMKVGESNIAGTVFLCNFQWGNYYLGEYGYLQTVVDYFNQTGAFCRFNVSTAPGFNAYTLLDPTLAPDAACEPNETPLACEYRRSHSAFAFVYLGIGDMYYATPSEFRGTFTEVIRSLKEWGVIPIVATYPMSDEFTFQNPRDYNAVIRSVARSENVPLIDMRAATFYYDRHGTGADGYHLSAPQDGVTAFTGNQDIYGRTLYEFYAMSVLYQLTNALN